MESVRVLTWNLWWRFGDWQRRLKAIDAVLQEVEPDICCFQEVWSTESEDAARQLGERNGLDYVARSYSNDPERWQRWIDQPGVDYGNAVVSRWPITSTRVRNLPGAHGRTALATRIATPRSEMPVVCTHLAAHPAASAERCAQVRAVVELVAAFGRRAFLPSSPVTSTPNPTRMRPGSSANDHVNLATQRRAGWSLRPAIYGFATTACGAKHQLTGFSWSTANWPTVPDTTGPHLGQQSRKFTPAASSLQVRLTCTEIPFNL